MKKISKQKRNKILKVGGISFAVIGAATTITTFFIGVFGLDGAIFNGNSSYTNAEVGIIAISFFCLGFLFVLWYPATRLIAWLKTRNLKNQNLQKDLILKDAKIDLMKSKTPIIYEQEILSEEE